MMDFFIFYYHPKNRNPIIIISFLKKYSTFFFLKLYFIFKFIYIDPLQTFPFFYIEKIIYDVIYKLRDILKLFENRMLC